MAQQDYGECERRVLLSEGGYTNDPRDPGGPTNWGITIYDARLYWKPDATADDVRAMPRSVAEQIYKSKYWDTLACDNLPAGLDYTCFDYGVNSGIRRSGRVLRACLGLPTDTWHVDQSVLDRLAQADVTKVIDEMNAERMRFLQHLKTWPHFGRGWGSRVLSVKAYSEHLAQLAQGSVQTQAPDHHVPGSGEDSAKAYADDAPIEGVTPVSCPNATQNATDEALETSPMRLNDPPGTSGPLPEWLVRKAQSQATEEDPGPPSMLKSKTGWAAIGLGGSGALDGLQQANDYASQLAQAKWSLSQLNVSQVLSWLYHHPIVLLPFVVVAASIFVYEDHKKYKRALYEATKQRA
jgi:lysozyme family protein